MKTHVHMRAELGDLVVAAYDEAARCSSDTREVSRLANKVVLHLLHALPSRPRFVRPRLKSAKPVS
jgi:hypothetical protein